MRRLVQVLVLYALFTMVVACQSAPVPTVSPTASKPTLPGGVIVVRNGAVIDGTGGGPIPGGLVAIRGGEIIAVGPEAQFQIPQDGQVVDAQGGTILPGFIDAHTHIFESAGTTQAVLNRWLRAGVTTVRDLGSRYGKGPPSLSIAAFKQQLAAYGNTVPTIVIAGPIMTAPGGYPVLTSGTYMVLEVADVEEARQETERLLADGADEIKIAVESYDPQQPLPVLTLEQVKAIAEVAHQHGTRVSAHVTRPQDAQVAIDGGVDDLAHKILFGKTSDELIQQMVSHGVWLVPTLVVEDEMADDLLGLTDEQMKEFVEIMQDGFRRYLAAGGKVAMGSDFGATERIPQGMPLPELQRMVEFGMTPMQVIVAATSHAAQVCNLGDRLGTLETGKQGDVIVVKGNPLEEIQAMGEVIIVIKNGEVIVQP
jgi:imidazolonepropionase-like amidohydrolase